MKGLPHKSPRSRTRSKRSTGRSRNAGIKWQVEPPAIFVRVPSSGWKTYKYMAAKIRVRRGCYRYLVWREGPFKRELYLGKIKNLTPQFSRGAAAAGLAAAGADRDIAGVQK